MSKSPEPLKPSKCINTQLKVPRVCLKLTQTSSFYAIWPKLYSWLGVARNEHLEGPCCNRNLLNIILKSIGYKIINFHISSYTWTCWQFNRNFKLERNKKIEKKKRQKKNNHTHKRVFTWFGNLPTSTELQGFHYYKRKLQCAVTVLIWIVTGKLRLQAICLCP